MRQYILIYKIKLLSEYDKDLIESIQDEHNEQVEGIYDYMIDYM
ncbi:hypothetical protein CULT_1540008 [[Clostridium] ultunense Esp]|nr:hypothetical protein CULT_1540008 [[Clostridium] ultunense Esp]